MTDYASESLTRRGTLRDRRYLALFFPWLPSERLRLCGAPADGPYAFVERVGSAMRLSAVDRMAAELGLVPGLAMADARARIPELELFDHDRQADEAWLDRIAEGCSRYTPVVAIDPPHGLILDTTGCDHLFDGEAGLAADLEDRMARTGMSLRHAFAATPEGARALARHATAPAQDEGAAIRRLSVAALELEEEASQALRRAGLKTVGEVARRPLAGIAARFGEQAVLAIRRMLGDADSALIPRRVVPPLIVERRLAEPVAHVDTVLAILSDLMVLAARTLEERHRGGRRFEAVLFRTDGLVRRLRIETGSPSRDVDSVMRLMRERIDTLSDPIDPGFGFDLVRLDVPVTEPLGTAQLRLEGGAVAETEVMALIERLSTRYGRGRVRRFGQRDTHIPEQAEFSLPAMDAAPPGIWLAPERGEPPLRPIHLFDPPQAIDVLGAEVPDGPPRRFRWRRTLHEVARFEGPERIAPQWWRQSPTPRICGEEGEETDLRYDLGDDAVRTRDYYRIEDRRGRRFWIFRHGLFEPGKPMPRWYLHGLFA